MVGLAAKLATKMVAKTSVQFITTSSGRRLDRSGNARVASRNGIAHPCAAHDAISVRVVGRKSGGCKFSSPDDCEFVEGGGSGDAAESEGADFQIS